LFAPLGDDMVPKYNEDWYDANFGGGAAHRNPNLNNAIMGGHMTHTNPGLNAGYFLDKQDYKKIKTYITQLVYFG